MRTTKNQYRKFETNIPRKGIAKPQSQFSHSCVCERFMYSHHRSAYSSAENMWTDPGNIYVNRSQTHECGNWDWGRAIPRKGIHKWHFRFSSVHSDRMWSLCVWIGCGSYYVDSILSEWTASLRNGPLTAWAAAHPSAHTSNFNILKEVIKIYFRDGSSPFNPFLWVFN